MGNFKYLEYFECTRIGVCSAAICQNQMINNDVLKFYKILFGQKIAIFSEF